MAGSVDIGSNGHLVAIDVVSGEKADDPLYRPVLQRLRQTLQESGLLYLGDSKMGALATRADIVGHFQVQGYLRYTFRREESTQTRYVGRGRGGKERAQRTITQVRYVIIGVERDEVAITAAAQRLGWRLYATNQQSAVLPLDEAFRLYRRASRMERHFHLFNAAPVGIEPLYVRRDDQIKGLTRLLSLCVRLLTLIEIVARRNLAQRGEKLAGLYEGNPKQQTDQPTATRLLKAFRHINRVHLSVAGQSPDTLQLLGISGQSVHYSTPLTPRQRQILSILELDDTIYQVPFQNSG
jgi:transposase